MNRYWPGQAVLVHGEFTDRTGAFVDPTTVTVKVKRPDSSAVTSANPTKLSTGIYEYVIDTTNGTPGEWHYRMEGVGAAIGADEKTFRLNKTLVA